MVAPSPAVSEERFHQERWVPPGDATELVLVRHGASAAAIAAASGVSPTVIAAAGAGAAVVVTHGAFIAELCSQATGSRPFAFLMVDNASITRVVALPGGGWVLRGFNDTAHLA
jgi:probable phosphoglycerate mutase